MIRSYKEDKHFPIDIDLGEYMRKIRHLRGQNQTDFGEDLGFTQTTISKWEAGDTYPYFDDAREIVKRLDGRVLIVPNEVYERIIAQGENDEI